MDKIVFVIGATKSGGAEKRAILISKILKDKYDTNVFAFHGESTQDIDCVYKPSYHEYKQTKKSERIKNLREYLIKEKPDFVFSFVPHINYFTTKALNDKQLNSVIHIVSVVFPFFKFPNNVLLKQSIKKADAVYYQLEEQKRYVKCSCPSFVIPNPIEVPPLINKEFKYKMLSVGRLEDQKDYPFMIQAFKKISNDIPEAILDIYGSGSQKKVLNHLIEYYSLVNKVTIHDYSDDIKDIYKHYDTFLFTSNKEGFPNALAEAMANSLVCFSTTFKTGCDELLINGKTGFVCDKDINSFANMVINNLKDNKELEVVSKNGYNHVKSLCDITKFKDKMIKELEGLKNGKIC